MQVVIDVVVLDLGVSMICDMGCVMVELCECYVGQMDFGVVGLMVKDCLMV